MVDPVQMRHLVLLEYDLNTLLKLVEQALMPVQQKAKIKEMIQAIAIDLGRFGSEAFADQGTDNQRSSGPVGSSAKHDSPSGDEGGTPPPG